MRVPLSVVVNVTDVFSSDLPLNWASTRVLASGTRYNELVPFATPLVDEALVFNAWTVVNKQQWDDLVYQWLYGGPPILWNSTNGLKIAVFESLSNAQFVMPTESHALTARAARQRFSLASGNIVVADFSMWFGDCWPDYGINGRYTTDSTSFSSGESGLLPTYVKQLNDNLGSELFMDHFCRPRAGLRYFDALLRSPWVTVESSRALQTVELTFASDWFVQVEEADNTRSCCGPPAGSSIAAAPPIPYEERGIVLLELTLDSGAVLLKPLRTWTPTPFVDKDKLEAPRNEAVALVWANAEGNDVRRVRAVWQVEKGFNQGCASQMLATTRPHSLYSCRTGFGLLTI